MAKTLPRFLFSVIIRPEPNGIHLRKLLIILNNARTINMASTEKITNLEAFNKYVKTYKSNTEAARQFMTDESVQGMKAIKSSGLSL